MGAVTGRLLEASTSCSVGTGLYVATVCGELDLQTWDRWLYVGELLVGCLNNKGIPCC